MNDIEKIEQLIKEVEKESLSNIIPRILPLALKSKDYKGYCVLLQLTNPIANSRETNAIQSKELETVLLLTGLCAEDAKKIISESKRELIELRSISQDQVSSHSIKEIENWMTDAKRLLETPDSITQKACLDLFNRLQEICKLYEVIRGHVLSKLTYYHQVLTLICAPKREDQQSDTCKTHCKNKIFIVHGHNGEIKEALARLLENQGIVPIILHEQVNQGGTIIEKFERNSDVGCAISLFTADDIGSKINASSQQARARQNVVFETGYFMGKLGREKVIILADKDVEIPSDLQGVLYIQTGNWRHDVLKELNVLGYDINFEKN